ncbi:MULTISPECIES: purine-nucleoside phosphorylase [Enterococcus]|uniref:purine-nucleoside phosphorylase n=1 Tax=Enterococcus TaxID=1350 RepID=UPI000CF2A3D1|nr:purine-nucleoside phosphorylase [Enterococcus faecalis]EGO2626374.1 purine-nucleoside phosphorylase [Enterococcus faecalis]EGO6670903.1 purine-nucleoside phosphorylase [Enterococcus faecalis]EGO8077406.1 purine-nucleoside phosphorylase [Enterococcus faecalis]EHE8458464.1 purine-nucleoside phosphorylase [Enterococcus faecalis]EHU4979451.1 purine-nucleoside phosphorylase [Enterococcus faecalis]
MSVHIEAKPGEIADKILLPGDPLRAKYIAETFLENPVCYNQVRGMLGYTGTYKGQRVSVQGTGMGMPSAGIYAHELINSYNVKKLIRVGTCGSISEKVNVRELVIAQAAATPSSAIRNDFPKYDFPQIASFDLLLKSYEIGKAKGFTTHVGNVLSDDVFYKDSLDDVFRLGRYGVLAIEMEAAMLYYLAAKFDVEALAIMTVSDSLVTGEETTAEERQTTFNEMIEVGLETAIAN